MITVNGSRVDLAGFVAFVTIVTADDPGPWTCKCGKRNRGKDLSCWDGCKAKRAEGEVK